MLIYFIIWFHLVFLFSRVSSDGAFNKRSSIGRAPRISSAPFCASIAIDANTVDSKSASLSEWAVMVSCCSLLCIYFPCQPKWGGGVKRSASRSYIGGQIGDTLAKLQYGSLTSLGANIFLRVLDCEMNSWKTHTISSILWCSSNSRRVPLETPPTPSWVRAGPVVPSPYLWCVYPWPQWTRFSLVD